MSRPHVDVIVPVYKGVDEVRACLESLALHTPTDVDMGVVLLDDASPEPEVSALLDVMAGSNRCWVLERNETNLGFVATVNRGFAMTDGDVVVLNADTVVTDGWLDRLHRAATSRSGVATVTPLTNFGSLATISPALVSAFDLDGPDPRIDEAADHVTRWSLGELPEVIAGVGFCMYVRREALEVVGAFDVETFGRGYGEEVDFCLRAGRLGFAHLIDDTTFVYHGGGVSFGDERTALMQAASAVIHQRYPFFRAANTAERRRQPLTDTLTSLELGLSEPVPGRPHVLHLLHSDPGALGGTEKHLAVLNAAIADEFDVSVMYPVPSGFVVRSDRRTVSGDTVRHEFLLPGAPARVDALVDASAAAALQMALDVLDVTAVHIQNLIGHSLAPLEVLADFDGPVVCSVRDLFLACPHHWLLFENTTGCGLPDDPDLCRRCLSETRGMDLERQLQHRALVRRHLSVIDHWVFANPTGADYLQRVYTVPEDRIRHIEHGAIVTRGHRQVDESLYRHEPLRLAFAGLGWAKKGLGQVNAAADHFADTQIEFHHLGRMKGTPSPNIICHGEYDNEQLGALFDAHGIHAVLLVGPYAETFGHVMTESLLAGRPVIGIRYGALGERIMRHRAGWVVDPDDPSELVDLIAALDVDRSELLGGARRAASVEVHSVADTAADYAALYRSPTPPTRS